MMQELHRLKELASEEVTAEKEKVALLEAYAQQRPTLSGLHKEVTQLRHELHAQNNDLRMTKSGMQGCAQL